MTNFQMILGWAVICSGLFFSIILFFFAARKYRQEITHNFSFRDFFFGMNRNQKPALQLFVEGLLGLLASAFLYFMLFAGER